MENSFNKYGFETPDFEGEIYASYETCGMTFYNGAIWIYEKDDYPYMKPVSWNTDGKIIHNHYKESYLSEFDLTLLKKEWYEKEENIGKLCITTDTKELFFLKSIKTDYKCVYATRDFRKGHRADMDFCDVSLCRPTTKEECLNLCIEK